MLYFYFTLYVFECTSIYIYNTAGFFPRFPLDSLAVYIVYIHDLFIYLHGSRWSLTWSTHLIDCS